MQALAHARVADPQSPLLRLVHRVPVLPPAVMRTRRRAATAASPGRRLALAEVSPSKKNASDGQREIFSSPVLSARKRLAFHTSDGLAQMAARISPSKPSSIRPMRTTRSTHQAKAAQDQLGLRKPSSAPPRKKVKPKSVTVQEQSSEGSSGEGSDDDKENVPPPQVAAVEGTSRPSRPLLKVHHAEPQSPTARKSSSGGTSFRTAAAWRESSHDSMAELEADYVVPAWSSPGALQRDNGTAEYPELPLSSTPFASPLRAHRQRSPGHAFGRSLLDDGMLSNDEGQDGARMAHHGPVAQRDSPAHYQEQQLQENKLERVESYVRSTNDALMSQSSSPRDKATQKPSSVREHLSTRFDSDEDEFGFFAAVRKGKGAAKQDDKKQPTSTTSADELIVHEDVCVAEPVNIQTSFSPASSISSLSDVESENDSFCKGTDEQDEAPQSDSDSSDIFSALHSQAKAQKRKRSGKLAMKASNSPWKVDDLVNSVLPRRRAALKSTARDRRRLSNNQDDQDSENDSEPRRITQIRSQRGKKRGRSTASSGRDVTNSRKKVGARAGAKSSGPSSTSIKSGARSSKGSRNRATRAAYRQASPDSDSGSALTELSSDEDGGAAKAKTKRERDELDDYALGEEWVI